MQARTSFSLDDLSDKDINDLLDEIEDQNEKKENVRTNKPPKKRRLSRRLTFTKLKQSVFAELDEKDHVEQERITWYKLNQWIEFEWFDKLYQDNKIKQHFVNDIKQAEIYYKSYTNKILIKYFKCPFKADKNNQRAEAFITNNTTDDAFVDFNFPYFFSKGLHHFVLFSRYDIANSLGTKQMKRLISHYISDKQYTANILSKDDEFEFIYYEERANLSFFQTEQYEFEKDERTPLLSEIIDENIIANIIHVFINITGQYRVVLGANNATWADESFLWEEATKIIKDKDIEKFGREEKWLRKYIQDRSKSKSKKKPAENTNEEKEKEKEIGFNSIRDKILIKEFKCKSKINNKTNKLIAIVDETTPRLLWTENLYPYFYEQGIEHNLCWYLDDTVEQNVLEAFITKNIGDKQYVYWENPPHLKSIPDLNHYQIISVDMNEYMRNIKHLFYVNKAYKWKEFVENKKIVNEYKCDRKYGWNERVCRRYLQEIEENKIRFESLFDADLRRYFKCKIKKNEFGKLIIDYGSGSDDKKENYIEKMNYDYQKYVFVADRYHFYLEDGLKQYLMVVWDKTKWENQKIKQIIQFELELDQQNANKFVFWEKTVDGKEKQPSNIWYYHVIFNYSSV